MVKIGICPNCKKEKELTKHHIKKGKTELICRDCHDIEHSKDAIPLRYIPNSLEKRKLKLSKKWGGNGIPPKHKCLGILPTIL